MAVVVDYDVKGNPITSSLNGIGISDSERDKALELDKLLQIKLEILKKKLVSSKTMPKKGSKKKVESYWEFGSIMRKIFFQSNLIMPTEKSLYWLNVKLHAPKELLVKDRGVNRIHVAYCFRLAGYQKKIAIKREWSEWVYLFDSPSINKESRFDRWDETKIKDDIKYTNRENVRFFAQCLNSMLKNIETSDLKDEEIIKCYESAWFLSNELIKNFENIKSKKFRSLITKKIVEKQYYVGELIDDIFTINQFVDKIINEVI